MNDEVLKRDAEAVRADVMDAFRRALEDRPYGDLEKQRELLEAIAHKRLSPHWEWRIREMIGGPLDIVIIGTKH